MQTLKTLKYYFCKHLQILCMQTAKPHQICVQTVKILKHYICKQRRPQILSMQTKKPSDIMYANNIDPPIHYVQRAVALTCYVGKQQWPSDSMCANNTVHQILCLQTARPSSFKFARNKGQQISCVQMALSLRYYKYKQQRPLDILYANRQSTHISC